MRWAEDNINGMLALRNLVCISRWEEGWKAIVNRPQPRRRKKVEEAALMSTDEITFEDVEVADSESEDGQQTVEKSAKTNPWREGK